MLLERLPRKDLDTAEMGWCVGCNPTSSLSNFLVVVFIVLVMVLSSPFASWLGWSVCVMFSHHAILYYGNSCL